MDLIKIALKWLAINFGNKHPVWSTALIMVLTGMVWVVFFKSVTANFADAPVTPPNITQHATDATCSNIVVTGGSATCEVEKEKRSDPNKGKNAQAPKDSP